MTNEEIAELKKLIDDWHIYLNKPGPLDILNLLSFCVNALGSAGFKGNLPQLISAYEALRSQLQDKDEELAMWKARAKAEGAKLEGAWTEFEMLKADMELLRNTRAELQAKCEKLEAVAEAARDLVNYWPKDLGDGFHISEYCNSDFSPYYRPRDSLSLAEALQALDAEAE